MRIKQSVLIQDHAEGGKKAPDVETFIKAMYIRKIRRIVEPHPGVHRNFIMYWIDKYYGFLRQGLRILTSNCDFLHFDDGTLKQAPAEWRAALKSIGALNGLTPAAPQGGLNPFEQYYELKTGCTHSGKDRTVAIGNRTWSIAEIFQEPIGYNPNLGGWWGAKITDSDTWLYENREKYKGVNLLRVSKGRRKLAKEMYSLLRSMAEKGVTHIIHIIKGGGVHDEVNFMTFREFTRMYGQRGGAPCSSEQYKALVQGIPEEWKEAVLNLENTRIKDKDYQLWEMAAQPYVWSERTLGSQIEKD